MDAVLPEIEDILCKKVKATQIYMYLDADVEMILDLLLFAEKYSMSKLISTAVKKLSTMPYRTLKSDRRYGDLTSNSKFMISDMRLDRVDNNKQLEEN